MLKTVATIGWFYTLLADGPTGFLFTIAPPPRPPADDHPRRARPRRQRAHILPRLDERIAGQSLPVDRDILDDSPS